MDPAKVFVLIPDWVCGRCFGLSGNKVTAL